MGGTGRFGGSQCQALAGGGARAGDSSRARSPQAGKRMLGGCPMMKTKTFSIASIYVPVKRRATLDATKVQALAESILESGQKAPILVRQDGERFVLVEGLHRLEACRSLGEETILGYLVEARQH